MMKIHFLQKWDNALPGWMGEAKYQGVCWIYAIWQIFRTNPLLLLCVSYTPFLIRKLIWKWKNQRPKRVIVVVQGYGRLNSVEADWTRARVNLPPSLNIVSLPHPSNLPEGWEMVEYKSLYYIVHNISLACIRIAHKVCNDNVIYVKNHLPVNATTAVGMEISEEEAFQLVFSGEYGFLYRMECLPTWVNYVDVNTKIWGVLSSFPTLLQAANFNRLSFVVSLCIMVLDINRHIIYKVYDRIFLLVANFVKEMVFRNRAGLYHFFGMFSSRWKYTDLERKHCYRLRESDPFFLHPNSRLKSYEDVMCIPWSQLEASDPQELEQYFRRQHFYRQLIGLEDIDSRMVNFSVERNTKVGIRVWWEEKFSLRVPFISSTKVLLPRCLRDYLSYKGGYRAFGCTTFTEPFHATAHIRGKSILVE